MFLQVSPEFQLKTEADLAVDHRFSQLINSVFLRNSKAKTYLYTKLVWQK